MEKAEVTDLISIVSGNVDVPKKTIKTVVDSFIEAIKSELEAGNEVGIRNLVTFKQKTWQEREAYNPASGRKYIVPERTMIRAKVSPKLNGK